ncbi:hypothetical protein QKT49_gp232 [Acanthamoeba castellanii medusavirus]|uniref:Uncharacterized protein n=1 Tax=Acanthamoeba castellanii medusavirus J1 TaxID=3114988 RepID=A0A3T1CXI4_9VIRU|nr:hypothetical protein QKT49_gp232 [Acanthamoeba castellanii medusavirus]BBI30531.1 hypothetical protein [Acanthamoeba castellanii medusavirus J1]
MSQSKLVAFGSSMAPGFVPIAFGKPIPGVFGELVHPSDSTNAAKVEAILKTYENLTEQVTIVLVGAFWRKGRDIVKAWAADRPNFTVDDRTCVETETPCRAFVDLVVEFALTNDPVGGKYIAASARKHRKAIDYADLRLRNLEIRKTGPFFTGINNWDLGSDRSAYDKFVEFFSPDCDEQFTFEAVEEIGRTILEANYAAALAHVKANAIKVILPYKGRQLRVILFNYTYFLAREMHDAIAQLFQDENYDISIGFTDELVNGKFRCSFSSELQKSGLARELAEFLGGGGNDNSAGGAWAYPKDWKFPYPLNNIIGIGSPVPASSKLPFPLEDIAIAQE